MSESFTMLAESSSARSKTAPTQGLIGDSTPPWHVGIIVVCFDYYCLGTFDG